MGKNSTFYLWGEEGYLIDKKIKDIVLAVAQENGDEPEVVWVDADEMGALELGQTLEFSPLFALSRVVIIRRPAWLGKSTRKVRKTEESLQVLQDYFQHENQGQVLILTSVEHNASNPVAKFLDKNARVINIKALSPKEMEDWCKAELSKRTVRVAPAGLKRIVNSGQDMYYLENFFDKLALMANQEVMGVDEIDEQLDSKQEINVFKLIDALLSRNLKASLAAFYQLQEQGEPHLKILFMISRQFFTFSRVKFYQEMGYTSAKIAAATSQKDFTVKKMMDKSSGFTSSEIRSLFGRLLETDTSFKTDSKDSRILMETLLVEFCKK